MTLADFYNIYIERRRWVKREKERTFTWKKMLIQDLSIIRYIELLRITCLAEQGFLSFQSPLRKYFLKCIIHLSPGLGDRRSGLLEAACT